MSVALAAAVLVCTVAAMAAEVMALVRVDQVLALAAAGPLEVHPTAFHRALAVLSVFYVCDLGLLLFMGDPVFRMYALAIVTMGCLLWVARKHVARWRTAVMLESTVCLVLLTDVAYTVLKTRGWWAF